MDGFFWGSSPLLAFFLRPTGQVLIFFFADNSFLLGLFPSTGSGNVFFTSFLPYRKKRMDARLNSVQKCEALLQSSKNPWRDYLFLANQ
jgi:hypothetical protein